MICWFKKKETLDPKTPDIAQAEVRATANQEKADKELASARRLAEALAEIRQRNGLGESLSFIFGGGSNGTRY